MLKTGSCHCGAVKFEVEFAENPVVSECNCSICSKSGYLHLIVPAENFHLVTGEESLTTYRFGTGVAKHHFCKVCGIKSFYIPRSNPNGFSVNFRCLDEAVNLKFSIKPFDGQNWEKHAAELKHLTEQAS
jgi:hypothetical protein